MIKSVVITGATSSIGTAIIDECIKRRIEVLALINPKSNNINRVSKSEFVEIEECALSDLSVYQNEKEYDVFIHLAWMSTAGDDARDLLLPQVFNIQYSIDAVNLAERLRCKTFIGSGSQAEYGRTNKVLTEIMETNPETAYGIAKLCSGQMTRLACKQKGIKHIWPRILSAYGPNCQKQTVINYTISELLEGRKPLLSGGEQIWDFIYTGDVARAILLLAEKGKDGEVYVIGSGISRPLKEYLLEIKTIVEKETGLQLELGLGEKTYKENAVMHLECDISKLKEDTGFSPLIDFPSGVKKTIECIKECR